MATEAANAERQARAQINVDSQVDRIAKALNVAPPPRTRADTKDGRNAAETERLATFLELVATAVDPNAAAYKTGQAPQSLGGIGDGYNEQEELAKAAGKGKGAEGEAEDAEESPVSDSNADDAIDQISRMKSRDKLQHIADNDKRVSVQTAARDRLASL